MMIGGRGQTVGRLGMLGAGGALAFLAVVALLALSGGGVARGEGSAQFAAADAVDVAAQVAQENLGVVPSQMEVVQTTRGRAMQAADRDLSAQGRMYSDPHSVFLVMAKGDFVANGASRPAGAPAPTGAFFFVSVTADTGVVTDWGLQAAQPDLQGLPPAKTVSVAAAAHERGAGRARGHRPPACVKRTARHVARRQFGVREPRHLVGVRTRARKATRRMGIKFSHGERGPLYFVNMTGHFVSHAPAFHQGHGTGKGNARHLTVVMRARNCGVLVVSLRNKPLHLRKLGHPVRL